MNQIVRKLLPLSIVVDLVDLSRGQCLSILPMIGERKGGGGHIDNLDWQFFLWVRVGRCIISI